MKKKNLLPILSLIALIVNLGCATINMSFIFDRTTVAHSSGAMVIENIGIEESSFKEILGDMGRLKPMYKNLSRKVIFTNDLDRIQKECKDERVIGCNKQSGKELWVYYNPDETDYLNTLCHEILHSVIENRFYEEELVEDITEYNVCFNPKFKIYYEDENGEYSEIDSLFIHKYIEEPDFYINNCGFNNGKYVCFGFFRAEELSIDLLNLLCTPKSDKEYSCENEGFLVEVLE